MKIYLIKHSGKVYWHSLEAWSDIVKAGQNGICVKSVKAFTKLKYAKEWIKRNKADHLEIISVNVE